MDAFLQRQKRRRNLVPSAAFLRRLRRPTTSVIHAPSSAASEQRKRPRRLTDDVRETLTSTPIRDCGRWVSDSSALIPVSRHLLVVVVGVGGMLRPSP
jgi:hypothetical protein